MSDHVSDSVFEIVRLLEIRGNNAWIGLLLYNTALRVRVIEELIAELEAQMSIPAAVILAEDLTVPQLLGRVAPDGTECVIIAGLESWDSERWVALDEDRNSLERSGPIIFLLDTVAASSLSRSAPNIRSFLGAIHLVIPGSSEMNQAEVERRLGALREFYGLSDQEVLEKAEARTLPSDPHFVEWLMLIDRGDLI